MSATAPSFYVTGGTLRHDAPSYVERQADCDLYEGLSRGDFCYVLTSRQMGKSSLMIRTAARLREEGAAVVVLDLTALGRNLTVEQWYDGLRDLVGQQLDLEDELDAFWREQARLGPLQRWMKAVREVVLAQVAGPIVLFVDEIDAVRSLPFDTDEFFAAIRECYNRRTEDPEFARLTFCLLGVASPSDLIRDTRTTPFNIGRRVELTDFSEAEAAPLATGLARRGETGRSLLDRVFYWTGGHPYLTQRLCQAVADDVSMMGPADVDGLCEELFLSLGARERDDNLLFVRERLLRSEADLASLLDLYAQVRRGKRVSDDETNPLVSLLRLSGITRTVGGRLGLRNRIYERVFDRAWVRTHMPDAELRRQRAAYRQGLLRTAAVASVIVVALGALSFSAIQSGFKARRAEHQARRSSTDKQNALIQARRLLYAAQMNVAQQAWEEGNVGRAQELLEAQQPEPGQEDLRGYEWRLLWHLCQGQELHSFRGHTGWVGSVAFSPDGTTLASGSRDTTVKLWDVTTKRLVATLRGHAALVSAVAFSPDGKALASASYDNTVRLWNVATRQAVSVHTRHRGVVTSVAFSPDGKYLATASDDRTVKLWDVWSRREVATLNGHTNVFLSVAFSPNGRLLAAGGGDKTVTLWDRRTGQAVAILRGHTGEIHAVAFSRDGKTLASGSFDGTVRFWDVGTKRQRDILWGPRAGVTSIAFSPDSQILATGGLDNTVELWNVATRRKLTTFSGHKDGVWCVAFSPDGKTLASGGGDGDASVKLWDAAARRVSSAVLPQKVPISAIAFSPDTRTLATGSASGTVTLWDLASRRAIASLEGHHNAIVQLVFSSGGKKLASSSEDAAVKLWDLASRRDLASFRGSTGVLGRSALAFSPDGKTLAMGIQAKAVKLWDLTSRRETAPLEGFAGEVWGVAFSPDGKTLAAYSPLDPVKLWDVASRREVARLNGWQGNNDYFLFSPDGKTLVTGGSIGPRLWDVATRQPVASLKGPVARDESVAISPDGKTLAMSNGNTVRLWNLQIRQEVATLKGHTSRVVSLAFAPDGDTLASASNDGTVRLWEATSFERADQPRMIAVGGRDRAVTLQWQPVPSALGYNVYRGPAGAAPAELVKLTRHPVAGTSFTDQSPGLVNGLPLIYAVAALYRGAAGHVLEGARVVLPATPMATPPGFLGCSINEGGNSGSVVFDAARSEITLRGSGWDIFSTADGFYFVNQPIEGDFQISVTALTRPKATHEWAHAGLMIREGLEPGARHASLVTTVQYGTQFKWRTTRNDVTDTADTISYDVLKFPITLRLTRRGDTITPEHSRDGGKSFQPYGGPLRFEPPLAKNVYVGLASTAHDPSKITESRFRALEIKKL